MIASTFLNELNEVNNFLSVSEFAGGSEVWSKIPLEVFAQLHMDDAMPWPAISKSVPHLPSDEVQRNWTGNAGIDLMKQSCSFIRSIVNNYVMHTGNPIHEANVLDYGCGWGRLSRLMLKYVRGSQIYAVDPWEESIRLCKEYSLPVNLAISDYVPHGLPVGQTKFNLIFAFSIFTHLSERCASTVMRTLRRYVKDDGLLAITIRPTEYWDVHSDFPEGCTREDLKEQHRCLGFAFTPHNRDPIDGDITYGDASLTLEYATKEWTDWNVVGTDYSLLDPYQVTVFLTPR